MPELQVVSDVAKLNKFDEILIYFFNKMSATENRWYAL